MVSIDWIKRKTIKAFRMLKERGLAATCRFVFIFIFEDRWLLGKFVELQGNTGTLDGCTFDLDQPVITTFLKSRFLLNSWEEEARYLFKKYQPIDLPLIELGASIGIVSCITNKQLTDPEAHIIVEANPNLLPVLEKNRAQNDCQFTVLNKAVAYGAEEVRFNLNDDRCNEGHLSTSNDGITLPATTLQEILDTAGFTKINMICDIEGAELALVENEGLVLSNYVDWIIVEVHGFERAEKTQSILEGHNFKLIEEFENNHIYRNNRWSNIPSNGEQG